MSCCRYCIEFVNSIRRLEPKIVDGEKKKVPNRRLCDATKQWVEEDGEMCEEFKTSNNFWCDKLQQCMDIDSCRNRRAKKLTRHCRKCSQYNDIIDTLRMRGKSAKAIVTKPILKRRVP